MKNLQFQRLQSRFLRAFSALFLIGVLCFKTAIFAQETKPQVRAVGVMEDGKEVPAPFTIEVKRQPETIIYALDGVIRFAENSITLPGYIAQLTPKQVTEFLPEQPIYAEASRPHLPNILGYRMKAAPSEKITLFEQDAALKRCEAVSAYLRTVWGIAPERISSKVKKSAAKNTVEISNDELLKPLVLAAPSLTASPPTVRFLSTSPVVEETPQQWSITIRQDGKPLRNPISAGGNIRNAVDWKINKERSAIPFAESPLKYQLELRYPTIANQRSAIGEIPVKQMTVDAERFVLRLIFSQNGTDLSASHNAALKALKERGFAKTPERITLTGIIAAFTQDSKALSISEAQMEKPSQSSRKSLGNGSTRHSA